MQLRPTVINENSFYPTLLCGESLVRVADMVADVLVMRADSAANRFYTQFQGKIVNAALQKEIPEFLRLLATLRPGFSLVTDLTALESMDLGCEQTLAKIMDHCRVHHVALVVRIIPDPRKDIGFNILGRIHYGHDVQIITCETREQAERAMGS